VVRNPAAADPHAGFDEVLHDPPRCRPQGPHSQTHQRRQRAEEFVFFLSRQSAEKMRGLGCIFPHRAPLFLLISIGTGWALPNVPASSSQAIIVPPLQRRSVSSTPAHLPPRALDGKATPVCEMGDNNEAYEMRLKGGGGAGKRRASMLYPLIFGPLYFFSVAIAIPASPALINTIISGDNTPTPQGQMKLGSLLATDAFFTLLTTNIWAVMSDKYGRKPFLAMSAAGIGIGAMIVGCSSSFAPMYIGAAIDGCTSCMFGLGQAYLCDFSEPSQLPANIGLFMGVSAGAFVRVCR